MERRRPRDHFTRVLSRICERLDASSESEIKWTDRFFKEENRSVVSIRALWVVGSYARGALHCGDLDLVIEATTSEFEGRRSVLPPLRAICRGFFKSPPDVRVYVGTLHENTSGLAFDSARLLWSSEQPDWRAAIEAILPDPSAGRFPRPTDAIPLRMEQLDTDIDKISRLVELEHARVVQWRFVPFTEVVPAEPAGDTEVDFCRLVTSLCGKQTQRLLPYLLGAFRSESDWPEHKWRRRGLEKTEFRNGGRDVLVGQPPVLVARLETLATCELALIPHLTQRGPNGIWFIGRGDEHPLVRRANDIRLFCLVEEDGQPVEVLCSGMTGHEGVVFDVFFSESAAAERARSDEIEFEMVTKVRVVTGRDLLALLSLADALYLESGEIALTHEGRLVLETDKTPNAIDVLDSLASLAATGSPQH